MTQVPMDDDDCVVLSSDEEVAPTPERIDGVPAAFTGDQCQSFNFESTFAGTPKDTKSTVKRKSDVFLDETKRSRVEEPYSPYNVTISEPIDCFALASPTPLSAEKAPTPIKSHSPPTKPSTPPSSWTPRCTRRRSVSACPLTPTTSNTTEEIPRVVENNLQVRALISPAKGKRKKKPRSVQNEFYGVYCLISRSTRPCYKNRCYIGYTVDPNRRIAQHNGGREKGGAKKTDSRGPWDMVCVVHGFPNHVAALRFEWAWQNPTVTKTLKGEKLKKEKKETPFMFQLRIACHLMNSKPFCRFGLTFRWLISSEEIPFPVSMPPPPHVKKRYGKVKKENSTVPEDIDGFDQMGTCSICNKKIEKLWHLMRCTSAGSLCSAHFHSTCLATNGLTKVSESKTQLFPLKSNCPKCGHSFVWGDAVREQRRILKVAQAAPDQFQSMVVKKEISCSD